MAHSNVIQDVLDSFGGDGCLDIELTGVHGGGLDDIFLESLGEFLRVAVIVGCKLQEGRRKNMISI